MNIIALVRACIFLSSFSPCFSLCIYSRTTCASIPVRVQIAIAMKFFKAALVAAPAYAASLLGTPELLHVIEDKVRNISSSAQFVPDGKMFMLRKDLSDLNAGFLINTTPNNFLNSSTSSITDISTTPDERADKYTILPNNIPIPPANATGLRGNGTLYDAGTVWIFNAFHLSETSQPGADPNKLIGFEHNEDYYANTHPTDSCTHKSIAVRYSNDLGRSWTRSDPKITKDKQNETCNSSDRFTGTGDFAAMWAPAVKKWIIIAQEGPLVMSESADALARPYTWTRIDPASCKTAPGFIADPEPLAHGDLKAVSGSNPSIIRDEKNALWHMVYAKWGGGIAYTKSNDLYRWETPIMLFPSNNNMAPNAVYPTLVGDEGDILTTNGTATMYFGANNTVTWGRPLWSVGVDLGPAVKANVSSFSCANGTTTNSASGTTSPLTSLAGSKSGVAQRKSRQNAKHRKGSSRQSRRYPGTPRCSSEVGQCS